MRTEQVTKFPVPPVLVLRGERFPCCRGNTKCRSPVQRSTIKPLSQPGIEQPGHNLRFSQGQLTPQTGDTMFLSSLAVLFSVVTFSSNLAMAVKRENRLQTLSRGWGDDITWVQTYEEGLYNAKKSNKPLMVIHHLEDCQYCQALKKVFAESEELQNLAKENFIMLNLMHETTDKNLAPDGQYVPRIMFIDPSLTVRADITGRYSNRLYTYEPQDVPVLIENMKKAMRLIQTEL